MTTEPSRSSAGVRAFRWIVSGLDIASGLFFTLLGILVLFGHSSWRMFLAIPNGWLGVIVLGHGIWAVVSGVKLITEQSPVRWRVGKRRHLIAATLSGSIIVLVWLAMFIETAMYSPDGFGLALGVFYYTVVFGCVAAYLLIVSLIMGRLNRALCTQPRTSVSNEVSTCGPHASVESSSRSETHTGSADD